MRNHTATHLLHAALRQVLGEHVKQSGSYVGPDRLRFDFSHHQPMTDDEIAEVERLVNQQILNAIPVATDIMTADEAKESGAMALFGEKYGDTVRVVSVEGFSKELCGGTHVENTSQIGPCFVTLETGIAAGVRRIEAITGPAAQRHMLELKRFRQEVASIVNRPEDDALEAVREDREQVSALTKELKRVKTEMFAGGSKSVGKETKVGEVTVHYHDFGETDRDTMSGWADTRKADANAVVGLALGSVGGKQTVIFAASSSAVRKHNLRAGDLAKAVLPKFGGRGGGKPNFAQGSVTNGTAVQALADALADAIEEKTGG
jgi:alanyl-tRNA synthetase